MTTIWSICRHCRLVLTPGGRPCKHCRTDHDDDTPEAA